MDIRLAGKMDGIEAASAIITELSIPIVFMTGYEEATVKNRAMRLKPLGYVLKPIDLQKMKSAFGISEGLFTLPAAIR